jgi:hypothetical protein
MYRRVWLGIDGPKVSLQETTIMTFNATAPLPLADGAVNQISTILNALAPLLWPIVVILAALIFRAQIGGALGRVSEVDVGTTKVLLQKQADSLANTTKAVMGTGDTTPQPSAITAAVAKTTSDPSGAILGAWRAVEDVAGQKVPPEQGLKSLSVPEAVSALTSKGLDPSLVVVAGMLESLREVAATKPKAINAATATSFVAAADDLSRLIVKSDLVK